MIFISLGIETKKKTSAELTSSSRKEGEEMNPFIRGFVGRATELFSVDRGDEKRSSSVPFSISLSISTDAYSS